jgi:hypothetical protein
MNTSGISLVWTVAAGLCITNNTLNLQMYEALAEWHDNYDVPSVQRETQECFVSCVPFFSSSLRRVSITVCDSPCAATVAFYFENPLLILFLFFFFVFVSSLVGFGWFSKHEATSVFYL